MGIITGTTMTTEAGGALYRLMTWLSPSYPVGAFAYSQGLEGAVTLGHVHDRHSAGEFISESLDCGALWSDAVILAASHKAAAAQDWPALKEINGFARAFLLTAELKLESLSLGRAFLDTTAEAWPTSMLHRLRQGVLGEIAYPVAVASAAAGHGIALTQTLEACLHAGVANLVSAAIRLVPLGQSEGQSIIAGLEGKIRAVAERAMTTEIEDLATASFAAEISSMLHETQTTRLFRS
ncbi:urease accessory protein UreF [Stappia sp. F7233]|uniref:Urease accessory protein UreF n=2 Tax=Stappia albiluteola TaxID=2758565 RepID=A0A839AE31_9HYPH|nr:urease accessory protein UreF [Stappia albiluteola]